ncbi:MAG: protein kinase [Armatimonadetes bacterium]|nr:protein kinase [Armatimonadota bacterium]
MNHPCEIDGHHVQGLLGRGGMGSVYLVTLPGSSETAALKLLHTTATTELDRLRFEREFRLAQKCDHPGLVRVFSNGFHQQSPYYTMEYVEGRNLREYFQQVRPQDWAGELGRVIDCLLQSMAHVHARSIIHRDLKPENVLVELDGTPRLLDFGLARSRGPDAMRLTDPNMVLGTIHYMAPEQILGGTVDSRTDLYGLGVVIYELVAGRLPFESEEGVQVLGQILYSEPKPLPQRDDLPPGLGELVGRLMAREPADRPSGAEQALESWRILFEKGRLPAIPDLAPPTAPFDPRFLGREAELEELLRMLEGVRQRSEGHRLALVTGPTGIGKSRLLRELAVRCRAQGACVLSGQAQEVESIPYQLWLSALKRASRDGLPQELEPFRAAFSSLLPHLGSDSRAQRFDPDRKFQLFEGMARLLLSRCPGGGLFLLEDLEWADDSSLEFLRYFVEQIEGRREPLAIVASAGQGRTGQWKGRLIELRPLDSKETEAMIASMLGGGTLEPATAARLYQQTGGNSLFIRELVATLLKDGKLQSAGGVWSLSRESRERRSSGALPRVVREAARKHLEGLGPQELDILRYAALIGQRFRFDVLARAIDVPSLELLDRVAGLVARGALRESEEDTTAFRFHSEPLWEVVQESMPARTRRDIHRRIATALQTRDQDFETVMELARHYRLSGDPGASARHLQEAAGRAQSSFAYAHAQNLYRAVLDLPDSAIFEARSAVREKLADALFGSGEAEEARQSYAALLEPGSDTGTRARLLRKIGTCAEALGAWEEAHRCLVGALELLGVGSREGWNGAIQRLLSILELMYRENPQRSLEICEISERFGRVLFYLRPPGWDQEMRNLALILQTLARVVPGVEPGIQSELFGAYLSLKNPLHSGKGLVRRLNRSAAAARKLPDGIRRGEVLRDVGYLMLLAGHASEAQAYCSEAEGLGHSIGDVRGLLQCQLRLSLILMHRREFEKALEYALKVAESSCVRSRTDRELGSLYAARCYARTSRPELARAYLDRVGTGSEMVPLVEELQLLAQAWVELAEEQPDQALATAQRGLRLCRRTGSVPFETLAFHHVRLEALSHPACTDERASRLDTYLSRFRSRAADFPELVRWVEDIRRRPRS